MIPPRMVALAAAFALALPCFSQSDNSTNGGWSKTGPSHSIGIFAGQSLLILGSDDVRRGYGGYYSVARPEPKFKLWSIPAQLVYEVGVNDTYSNGFDQPKNEHPALFATPYARYRFRTGHGMGLYLDAGMGLYWTHTTHDINSVVSTAPTLDLGVAFRQGQRKEELLVGFRYQHVSDGGTNGRNPGQNGLFLTAEYRY